VLHVATHNGLIPHCLKLLETVTLHYLNNGSARFLFLRDWSAYRVPRSVSATYKVIYAQTVPLFG
jgi:hypothetical protein